MVPPQSLLLFRRGRGHGYGYIMVGCGHGHGYALVDVFTVARTDAPRCLPSSWRSETSSPATRASPILSFAKPLNYTLHCVSSSQS